MNGSEVKQLGVVDIPVCFEDSDWFTERFYVCETEGPAILSCNMSEKLGIISVTESRNISVMGSSRSEVLSHREIPDRDVLKGMYPKCFEGIGKMPKEYKIELKRDAVPVISPPPSEKISGAVEERNI